MKNRAKLIWNLLVIGIFFTCNSWADSTETVVPTAEATANLLASDSAFLLDPYESLEQIASHRFQNLIVRSELAKRTHENENFPQKMRDFAEAAYYFYSENWDGAFNAYEKLRSVDSTLEKNIILRMAKSRFMQGDFQGMRNALALGEKFESDAVFDKSASRMRIEAAMADSSLSDHAHADSLKAFLDKYPKGEDAVALKYSYAVYLEKFNQPKLAKRYYLQLLTSSTEYRDSAFTAIRRLRQVKESPESLSEKVAYAKMACDKDDASECLAILDSIRIMDSLEVAKNPELAQVVTDDSLQMLLPPSTLDMETRIILWEKRAVVLRTLNRDAEAIDQFVFLLDSVEARPLWMQSTLRLYRKKASVYSKQIKAMDARLREVSKFSKEYANNLWVRALEYEQNNKFDSAIACYKKLTHKRFRKNAKRQWAKFRIGFVYYKQGKWKKAIDAFISATKDPFLWSGSAARMFLGDAYMKIGKDSLARKAYLDCIKDFPLAYYAHRARTKLVEYNLMKAQDVPYAHGIAMSPEQTLSWIRTLQKNVMADTSYNPERYRRVRNLFLYGFADEAFALYDEARRKNYKRLDFLYEYGMLFYEMGEVAAGYRLARQFQNAVDRRRLMMPPISVLHYLYPIPFVDQVRYHSGSRIDPFFVYSVMRQESIFNFQIASRVGACGLLQIMPSTGAMLAGKENIAEWFDPKLLFNPYLNIRLGIRYLVDLKAEYNDDYMYVLSNYNAGPKPTKRWQAASEGLDWDIRVEEISYWETRDYVKRVLGNYWIYQEIYDKL